MRKIGITGGIGAGKSLVSALFRRLGASVYDSDSRAKELTNSNVQIIEGIKKLFGDGAYLNGELQRKYIASKVFSDQSLLAELNKIVHPIVAIDFELWCEEQLHKGVKYITLESAILIESGFHTLVDRVVCVTAPIEVRVERVVARDASLKEDVMCRMNNQLSDAERCMHSQYEIVNDDKELLMPQIIKLNSIFSDENI